MVRGARFLLPVDEDLPIDPRHARVDKALDCLVAGYSLERGDRKPQRGA
jgi:hypothetical protein